MKQSQEEILTGAKQASAQAMHPAPDDLAAAGTKAPESAESSAQPAATGASIGDCLSRIADSYGIRVCDKGMDWDGLSPLRHFVQTQAGNMGLGVTISPRPERFEAKDLPALVRYADGSFAVLEKKCGRKLEAWNKNAFVMANSAKELEQFEDWACSFDLPFETDTVPFLSLTWFTRQVERMWPIYAQVLLASTMIHCFTLVIPLLMGIFYDRILPNLADSSLRVLATGAIIVLVFDYLLKNVRSSMVEKAALKVEREAEPHLLGEVLKVVHSALPVSVGHLTHAVQEFSRIKTLFTSQLVLGALDFFFLFFFLFVIFLNSGLLVVVPLVISILVLLVSLAYGLFVDRTVATQTQLQSRRSAFLNEVFQGMESIKVANAASAFVSRWGHEVEKSGEMGARYRLAQSRCSMTTSLLSQLNSVGLLVVAFALIGSGSMSSGGLLTTMVLSGRCVAVCASMANLLTSYLFARRSYKDLYAILHLEKEPCEARHLLVQNVRGDLAFDAVSFRYHPEAPYVLENISFSIRAGERVGIIGPMGGGKTTLLKLVAGLAKPSEGVLLLDDYNMAHLNIEKVREHIGVVPQSPVLFHGTLEFNLLMGARCVTQEALQHALEISGIGSFVSKHPLGLKMHIAEGGKNLSRGQRQSVAIARALVGAPPILLLDEPTSSMDSAQEKVFVERMRTEMQGKTMLVVTHRPNILQIVDRILVIDQGRLAADGPRDVILAKLGQAPCVQGGQA